MSRRRLVTNSNEPIAVVLTASENTYKAVSSRPSGVNI